MPRERNLCKKLMRYENGGIKRLIYLYKNGDANKIGGAKTDNR